MELPAGPLLFIKNAPNIIMEEVSGILAFGLCYGAVGYGLYRLNRVYNELGKIVNRMAETVERVGIIEKKLDIIEERVGIIEKKVYIIEEVRNVTYDVAIDGILDRIGEEKITTMKEYPELLEFNKHPMSLYS